ncbi:hypothetical protein ACFVJS_23475 [Nocardioides sp. NPDC057772]|uniref:hypothetical protein n=1 Tax=Nocardioides sp. NPDC057772 TaxID=3346245 RepID=UPI00366C4929
MTGSSVMSRAVLPLAGGALLSLAVVAGAVGGAVALFGPEESEAAAPPPEVCSAVADVMPAEVSRVGDVRRTDSADRVSMCSFRGTTSAGETSVLVSLTTVGDTGPAARMEDDPERFVSLHCVALEGFTKVPQASGIPQGTYDEVPDRWCAATEVRGGEDDSLEAAAGAGVVHNRVEHIGGSSYVQVTILRPGVDVEGLEELAVDVVEALRT